MGEAESEVCVAVLNEGMMVIDMPKVAGSECENLPVVGGTETELYRNEKAEEVLAHTDMECFTNNQACESLKNTELESLAEGKGNEGPNVPDLEHCVTNEVKEASNDDMFSEVSNPNLSPKGHTSSFQTFSSQLVECTNNNQGVCGEITSSCSGAEESLGMEDPRSYEASGPVSTSCVVLEIPKEFSTTGVRKITLKFSKCKEDKDPLSAPTALPLSKGVNGGFNQLKAWNPVESSGMDVELNSSTTKENMELKMSKKVVPDIYPTNVKKLLSTKILEGAQVKYISTSGQVISGLLCIMTGEII